MFVSHATEKGASLVPPDTPWEMYIYMNSFIMGIFAFCFRRTEAGPQSDGEPGLNVLVMRRPVARRGRNQSGAISKDLERAECKQTIECK